MKSEVELNVWRHELVVTNIPKFQLLVSSLVNISSPSVSAMLESDSASSEWPVAYIALYICS